MRLELREPGGRGWIGTFRVDSESRPTKAVTEGAGREVFLNWESALDDAGRLRRCVVCGCGDLFQEKAFPQVTGIVIVLAFAGAAAGLLGLVDNLPVLIAMTAVLALDVGILLFSKRRLVCYRCRSSYHELPVARYHRRWERATADRYAVTPRDAGRSQLAIPPRAAPSRPAARAEGIST